MTNDLKWQITQNDKRWMLNDYMTIDILLKQKITWNDHRQIVQNDKWIIRNITKGQIT